MELLREFNGGRAASVTDNLFVGQRDGNIMNDGAQMHFMVLRNTDSYMLNHTYKYSGNFGSLCNQLPFSRLE